MTRSSAFLLAGLLASAPASAQDAPPAPDEATRAAVRRFRAATDPAEARRAFDDLRARSASSPYAAVACGVLAAQSGSVVADRGVAIECLRRGAQAGVPQAQHHLALALLDEPGGNGRAEAEKLLAQAARALPESVYLLAKLRAARTTDPAAATRSTIEEAAKADYAPAQRELAVLRLREGRREEASAWLEKASAQGDAEATYERAMLLAAERREADVPQVVGLLARSSVLGSARAQYALGLRYLNADGVRRDTAQAADLFRRAAGAGLADAQYALGHVLADGLGLAADEALALQWFELAANQGNVQAMHALGNAHANGWGTGRSLDMAYRWYCRAAQRGHEPSRRLVRGSSHGADCALPASPAGAQATKPVATTTQPPPAR